MSNQVVANRYAEALFQLAKEKDQLEVITKDLQLVQEVAAKTPQFIQYMSHPKVTNAEKNEFIKENFGQAISEMSLNTLYLLIEKKRLDSLFSMITKFQALANEARGVAEATVYTAKPLSEDEQERIADIFAKKVKKSKLLVKNIVNPDLIGGMRIRIDDYIFDGSIQAQLKKLERELIAGTR